MTLSESVYCYKVASCVCIASCVLKFQEQFDAGHCSPKQWLIVLCDCYGGTVLSQNGGWQDAACL